MEAHTLTSESALTELRKYIIKPSIKKNISLMSGLLVLIGIIAFFTKSYLLTIFCFLGIDIFFLELYVLSKKQIQMTLKRLRELYGTDKIEGKLVFENDTLRTVNFVTNGELPLSYEVMALFAETQNYYALFTKEHQALIVDKQQFTPETKEQFLQLVHEKMPALLIKPRKGK